MTKQIAKKQNKPMSQDKPVSVDVFIQKAIEQQLPVETMERLFALREKVKAEQAREAFTEALGKFQSECPIIEKNKTVLNKDGRTVRYKYASLDKIVETIKEPLASNGLAYSFDVEQEEGSVKPVAIVTHTFGHQEKTSFEIPVDKDSFMTKPQQYASALTFGKRYALCNALGILTGEEDTDATDVNAEKEPKEIKAKIMFLLRALQFEGKEKEEIKKKVKELTKLDLEEKNFEEIKGRLQVLVEEKQNDESTKV